MGSSTVICLKLNGEARESRGKNLHGATARPRNLQQKHTLNMRAVSVSEWAALDLIQKSRTKMEFFSCYVPCSTKWQKLLNIYEKGHNFPKTWARGCGRCPGMGVVALSPKRLCLMSPLRDPWGTPSALPK